MKISFIYPEKGVFGNNRNWMWWVAKGLEKNHTILYNEISDDTDLILGMSIGMIQIIKRAINKNPNTPYILYNWDMHPMLQPEVGKWDEIGWGTMMEGALDVWTQTQYHADLAKKLSGVDQFVMPICALDYEFEDVEKTEGSYALMASRDDPYKQFPLFRGATDLAGIGRIERHPEPDDRDGYIKDLAGCKVLVIASEEEANTPMSGYEGAFCHKPLLLSDIPVHREEWGDNATYFKNKNMTDLSIKLQSDFTGMGEKAYNHAMKNYTLQGFVDRIESRICEVTSS